MAKKTIEDIGVVNNVMLTRIKASLRNVARFAPQINECLNNSIHPYATGPRGGKMFQCAKCKGPFPRKEVQVDHTDPVVPIELRTKHMDWNDIIERMFCPVENLKVLCKPCHLIKSNEERKQRKQFRDDIL